MNRFLFFLISLVCFSCNNPNEPKSVVDFSETDSSNTDTITKKTKPVYIAIASMISPKETFIYYNDLVNYVSKEVGHPIFIKQKKTYEEVNELLENGEVDFAFICSGAYVDILKKRKVKLLAVPKVDGELFYNALIIAHKGHGISDFSDFKGHSFAFTDPLSNTGRLFPMMKLAELKKNETDFFSKTTFSYGHDISIQLVNRGIIDGASVHGLIFDYLESYNPERVENIEIIERSERFGIPPVVAPRSLDRKTFEKYQEVFLNIHHDSIGSQILEKLNIDSFEVVGDSLYQNVFILKKFIADVEKK